MPARSSPISLSDVQELPAHVSNAVPPSIRQNEKKVM
jgi:hypothetical protein